jgi:hypothetical protein
MMCFSSVESVILARIKEKRHLGAKVDFGRLEGVFRREPELKHVIRLTKPLYNAGVA